MLQHNGSTSRNAYLLKGRYHEAIIWNYVDYMHAVLYGCLQKR